MSEAELWELFLLRESLVLEYLVFLTSAASAYLLVAYYIGKQLTSLPMYIVSAFFVFASFICILVLLRFSGHLKMSAIMRTEVFHDEEKKLPAIQPRVQARGHQASL